MKLAIVGSRILEDTEENLAIITEMVKRNVTGITEIVSGGARGADTLAEKFAKQEKIPFKVFEANWAKYGRAAGPLRNAQIVDHCDQLIAFFVNQTKSIGTKDSVNKAKRAGKLLVTYEFSEVKEMLENQDLTDFFE